jgi:hypothetical protein
MDQAPPVSPPLPAWPGRPQSLWDRVHARNPYLVAQLIDLHCYYGSVHNLYENEPWMFSPEDGWDTVVRVLDDLWGILEEMLDGDQNARLVAQVRTSAIRPPGLVGEGEAKDKTEAA